MGRNQPDPDPGSPQVSRSAAFRGSASTILAPLEVSGKQVRDSDLPDLVTVDHDRDGLRLLEHLSFRYRPPFGSE